VSTRPPHVGVMILFPLVVYPLLSLLVAQVAVSRDKTRQERPSLVAVTGTGGARDDLAARIRDRPKLFTLVGGGSRADVAAGRLDGLVHFGQARRAEIVYDAGREESREAAERLSDVIASALPEVVRPYSRLRSAAWPRGWPGWLPSVQGAAAAGGPDGPAWRLLPGHRCHGGRAREGHARDHPFVTHPAL